MLYTVLLKSIGLVDFFIDLFFKLNYNMLKRLSDHQTGFGQTRLGDKFGIHQTTIGRQLAKMGIPYRKREKTPKYSANQQQRE